MQAPDTTTPPPPPAPAPVGVSIAGARGIAPGAARTRQYVIFELPPEIPIDERAIELEGQRYAVLEVWYALLSLQEDKLVAQRIGSNADNPTIIALYKTTAALRFVRCAVLSTTIDDNGQPVESYNPDNAVEFATSYHDGTAEGIFAAMHPGLRDVVMLGYASSATVSEANTSRFLKSRRTAVR